MADDEDRSAAGSSSLPGLVPYLALARFALRAFCFAIFAAR